VDAYKVCNKLVCDDYVANANPWSIFHTRVYRFDGLQMRVPGFDYRCTGLAYRWAEFTRGCYCAGKLIFSGY